MTLSIIPRARGLGAEVEGLDPRDASEAKIARLVAALARHGVLVLRDQHLSPNELVTFSRRFGELEYHVLDQYWLPEEPLVYVISNVIENGRPIGNPREGFGWHTDLNYMERPTAVTFLLGLEVPPEGGETLFADAYAATDALSPEERDPLAALSLKHSYAMLHASRPWAPPLTEEQKRRTPDVVHPLLRTHPETGRKGMYLGGPTCALPLGMDETEGLALLHRLFERATAPHHVYAHRWRPGDLAFWDNRGVLHTATEYDRERHRRIVWRTSVRGERPF